MSIRVSIIGSSNIAFEHLKALNEVGIEVSSVAASSNSISAKHFSKKYNLKYYNNVNQLIKNFNDDGLVIACKSDFLLPVLQKSMQLNTKILIEKPITNKPEKIHNLLDSKNIMVGFNRRHYQSVKSLKKIIDKNRSTKYFGNLQIPENIISTKISKKNHLNELINNGIHNIDLVNYLFGKVNIKNISYQKLNLSSYSFTLYNSKCHIEVTSISNAIQNTQFDIYTKKSRYQLLPIEKLNIYDELEIQEPTNSYPLRSYTPRLSKSYTEKNFLFKPGFLGQAEVFCNFIKNNNRSTPPGIIDAYNSLALLNKLM
tara:strand:- start:2173 stop:3114 length:942 start_codon:yes stop_codon:yes gene_type:complete